MRPVDAARRFLGSSITRQFVLAVLVVNLILVAMLGSEIVGRDRAHLDHARMVRAQGLARILAESATGPLERNDLAALQRLANVASAIDAVNSIAFEAPSGQALARSVKRPDQPSSRQYLREPASGVAGAHLVSITDRSIEAAASIDRDGDTLGTVRVVLTRDDYPQAEREVAWAAIAYGAALVLLSALIAFLTARSVSNRLATLAGVADRFRLGERSVRATDVRADEVGTVASGVNAMLDTIAESERSLQNVFRIAQIGSWRYAPSSGHVEWSETLYEAVGLDPSVAPPPPDEFLKRLPGGDRRKLIDLLEAGEPGQSVSFRFKFTRLDGAERTCWAEARLDICASTGERFLSGICQDITDREAAASQLRQAQKMEAVGQLTGGLAHDFNNLLAIVIGNLDMLDEELEKSSGARESLEEALAAALRGAELTKQLLAFSRRQSLIPQKVDLNRLVAGMSSLWRRTLGEAIEVRVHLAENLWPTHADPTQVETAILNLVINARDAMPQGGQLTVETQNMCLDAGEHDDPENDIEPGDYCVVAVSDTGCGMSADVIAQAFEPFFTTKGVGKGSGLGLSMIYGFARQSNGAVKIYSEVGYGTTVRLYLPRFATGHKAEAETADAPSALPMGSNETILVVEDNDAVRRIVSRQLSDLGYKVIAASNGAEALGILDRDTKIDLLFSDVVMPGGLDGFELARAAATKRPDLRVLLTSGFARPGTHGSSAADETIPLLNKPYRKVDLAMKLRELLGGVLQRR